MISPLIVTALCFAFQVPASGADDREVLPLRVEDVAQFVLERAPAVRQAHLAALANSGSLEEAEGIFDPVFFADATYSYAEHPSAGGFLSGGINNTHIRSLQANQGIRTLLMTGASVALTVHEQYVEDNLPASFFGLNPESQASLSLSVTQPILRGGWSATVTQAVRSAEIAYDRGLADLRQSMLVNLQAAVDAYWSLAFAIEDVRVKEISLNRAQELKEVTEARYRVGAAAEVEVVQTEADIAVRREALLTARNTVRQAEDALRILIMNLQEQMEWDYRFVPVSEPPAAQKIDVQWESAFGVAREHRAELRQLQLDVDQARVNLDVAEANLSPRLDLTATGNTTGLDSQIPDAFRNAASILSHGYSIGFLLEVPLGNNQYSGAERRARTLFQLAQRALRDQEHAIANEVRDAVRNVNYLAERVVAVTRAREVAQRQLEAEERRLQEGASTNFQVLQFQEDLARAESGEIFVRLEYAKAVTRLRLVQGLNYDGSAPQGVEEPVPAPPMADDADAEAEAPSEE